MRKIATKARMLANGKECWGLATLALDRGAPGEGKGGDELVFDALQLEAENGVHRYVGRARRLARASRIRAPRRLEKTRACARKIMAARPW